MERKGLLAFELCALEFGRFINQLREQDRLDLASSGEAYVQENAKADVTRLD